MAEEKQLPLEYLSDMQDLMDLYEFMDDEDLGEAMDLALKVLAKPDMPPAAAKIAMVRFQALAFKFKMMAQAYTTIKAGRAGSDNYQRKNIYYSANDICQEMTNTLKYLVKEQF